MTTFALELKAFADRTKAENEAIAKTALLDVFEEIRRRSPVDTGFFRLNWTLTTDAPGPATPITEALSVTLPPQVVGRVHFITNNLPYARRLETGWSQQAPNGMVGLTVLRWPEIVNKAKGEARR